MWESVSQSVESNRNWIYRQHQADERDEPHDRVWDWQESDHEGKGSSRASSAQTRLLATVPNGTC